MEYYQGCKRTVLLHSLKMMAEGKHTRLPSKENKYYVSSIYEERKEDFFEEEHPELDCLIVHKDKVLKDLLLREKLSCMLSIMGMQI